MVRPRQEFLGPITLLDELGTGSVDGSDAEVENVTATRFTSRASTPTTGASVGIFWVESGSPTLPKFTDSDGTTITLGGVGAAGGDLDGYFPNPDVVSAHFNGDQVDFDTTIEDGYILQRSGNSIIGIDPVSIIGPGYPVGSAGGDLDGSYPNPEVVAAQFDATRLTFGSTTDGEALIRSGSEIISSEFVSPTDTVSGDLDGYYSSPNVIAAQFDAERLTFSSVEDGYILIRDGSTVSGVSIQEIIDSFGTSDGYVPVHHSIAISTTGQTVFTLNHTPYDGWVELFLGGIKQEISDYGVVGDQLTWYGTETIQNTDILEVAYSRIVPFLIADSGTGTPVGEAGGDLDGYYPDPEVIAAQFDATRLTFGAVSNGEVLIRSGSEIIGTASVPPSGAAGGDLDGYYPDPEVIAAQFDAERLTFSSVDDGYFLVRSGSSIVGLPSAPPSGTAGGDLGGTYPDPEVEAAQFDTERLSFGAVDDGYFLVRSGSTVVGLPSAPPSGTAGGDLSGTYPDPEVVAAQFGTSRLELSSIADGSLLQRSGSFVIGEDPDNLTLAGDVTGTLGASVVGSADFSGETLTFSSVEDGYVLRRVGSNVVGISTTDIFSEVINDGYMPIHEGLAVSSPGQTLFTLSEEPYNDDVSLFINGIKQEIGDYSISGYTLTWSGALTIQLTDVVEVSYFKVIIDGGGYIINGQGLASTLLFGNTTNGSDIIVTAGDSILGSAGTVTIGNSILVPTDGYIGNNLEVAGKLTVGGLIDPTGIVLDEVTSNPNDNPQAGKTTIWIRSSDKAPVVVGEDGYTSTLQRNYNIYQTIYALQSATLGNINGSAASADSVFWIKVSFVCYIAFNSAAGATYLEQNILVRKGYADDYTVLSNSEIYKQGTTGDFTISTSISGSIISVIATSNEATDPLRFSGSYEIGGI